MTDELEQELPGSEVIEASTDVELDTETESDTDQLAEQEAEPTDPSPEKQKDSQGVQRRIDELTRARREAEREAAYWRKQAETPASPAAPPESIKTLEDFEYDEKAYQTYLFAEISKQAVESARNELKAELQRTQQFSKLGEYEGKEAEYAKQAADYYEVTRNPSLSYTETMHEIVTDLDDGPSVAYYLGKNPDMADRIARMDVKRQAVELGRIEERLKIQRSQKPKTVSDAPEPTPKLKAVVGKVTKDPTEMTEKEFEQWRRKAISNR